ncbi:MAG: DUF1571 domain-containing protein [Gemmataceae bacterium]|nr:DUF1571 domain-containing protein [Gemmataceae bacterium]MDW8242436.1 DUF1571 domain-containing protein [Thermogemmata sp.]
MARWWAGLIGLTLAVGCTRYGLNPPGGPFARGERGRDAIPGAAATEDATQGRPGQGVIPASGQLPLRRPLLPRRRGAVPAEALPSPYAKDAPLPPIPPTAHGPTPNAGPALLPPAGPPPEGVVPPATPPTVVPPSSSPAVPPTPPRPPSTSEPQPPTSTKQPANTETPATAAPSTSPSPPTPATSPSSNAEGTAAIRQLLQTARQRWATINTYEAIVVRRELAPNKQRTYDRVFYQFRKEPFAVYMRNLDEANAGRELLYNPQQHGDKIYAIVGKADEGLLYKAGQRAPAVSPDFPMVKQKSRYSIREAGLGTPLQRVQQWLEKVERGQIPPQNLRFQANVQRPETSEPLHLVELTVRPGDDPLLPTGGRRQWFFHANPQAPSYALPILIRALESDGQEVEYYWIERFEPNVRLTDADFHPDRLGTTPNKKDDREPKRLLPKK